MTANASHTPLCDALGANKGDICDWMRLAIRMEREKAEMLDALKRAQHCAARTVFDRQEMLDILADAIQKAEGA